MNLAQFGWLAPSSGLTTHRKVHMVITHMMDNSQNTQQWSENKTLDSQLKSLIPIKRSQNGFWENVKDLEQKKSGETFQLRRGKGKAVVFTYFLQRLWNQIFQSFCLTQCLSVLCTIMSIISYCLLFYVIPIHIKEMCNMCKPKH